MHQRQRQMSLSEVELRAGNTVKIVVVYRHMEGEDLQGIVRAAFQLTSDVQGVRDRLGAVFPISLLTKTPSFFSDGPYDLVYPAQATNKPVQGRLKRSNTVSKVFHLGDMDYTQIVQNFRCASFFSPSFLFAALTQKNSETP